MTLTVDEIIDNFSFIDDWEERYRYVIELGRDLEELSDAEKSDFNKVQGCVSQVWLVSESKPGDGAPILTFRGDSDAHIVKGLVAITLSIYSGRSAEDIQSLDAEEVFAQIGLRDHLTPQRSNGLTAMLERIKSDARKAMQA